MKSFKFDKALIAVGSVAMAAVIGSTATGQSVKSWYPTLIKSPLNPPPQVFGPAWTILYILMMVAFYQILTAPKSVKRAQAIRIFAWQLALNAMWSLVFFGLMNVSAALVVIVAMWFSIIATMFAFAQVRRSAANLLWPYLLWVSFAAYLNYSVLVLN